MGYPEADSIKELIEAARRIVILQADNPDGDSLGSSLALEHILGDLGKEPAMYCAIDMPSYLKYLPGWDRVVKDLPSQFDLSIIVDASTMTLFEKLQQAGHQGWLASKPSIVLDHHEQVQNDIPFASVLLNDPKRSSTGELIYVLAKQLGWKITPQAGECIMTAILGDSQGLSNSLASAETYRVMAELVELGADRPALEEKRREFNKMTEAIFHYKAELIKRTELHAGGRAALVTIPQDEINEFSPQYNPAPLIQGDMLQVENVKVAIVLKSYGDGHITGAIRCNPGGEVAAELAEHFGGGGHAYASGFKVAGKSSEDVKTEVIRSASELLDKLGKS